MKKIILFGLLTLIQTAVFADSSTTKLHIHGDDTGSSITDYSLSPYMIQVIGDATQSTEESRFGGKSIKFDGSGDSLSVSNIGPDFSNFTLDFWLKSGSSNGGLVQIGNNLSLSLSGSYIKVIHDGNTKLSSTTISSSWTHIALERAGTSLTLYINGQSILGFGQNNACIFGTSIVGECTVGSDQVNIAGESYPLGTLTIGNPDYSGFIDEFRLVIGEAKYQALSFTTSTEAYPNTVSVPDGLSIDYTGSGATISLPTGNTGVVSLPTDYNEIVLNSSQSINFGASILESSSTGSVNGQSVATTISNIIGGTYSAPLVKEITLNSGVTNAPVKITASNITLEIPSGTKVYSSTSWDGKINPPINKKTTFTMSGFTTSDAIQVGTTSSGTPIIFDSPAKVTLASNVGNPYYRHDSSSSWTQITSQCSNASGGGIVFPNECYFKESGQTYIYTYHLTDYGIFNPSTGDYNTEVTFSVTDGAVTIGGPITIDFGTGTVSNVDTYVSIHTGTGNTTGDSEYFWLEDLKSATGGYSTTLRINNLVADGSKLISSGNITLTLTGGTGNISVLDGLQGTGSTKPNEIVLTNHNDQVFGSEAIIAMSRTGATTPVSGIVGKYGFQPDFKVRVPAYQEIGNYTSTLTYTLIE